MKILRQTWFYALKDLKLFSTDRLALFFAILFPFFFVIMFSFMLKDIGGDDERIELHLVTREAEGGISYEIIESMETTEDAQLEPGEAVIIWDSDYDEAYRAVENKEIEGFLAFPEDFSMGIMMGYGAQLEIVADAEANRTRAALNGLGSAIASRIGSQQVASDAITGLLVGQSMAATGDTSDVGPALQQLLSGPGGMASAESFLQFETVTVGEVEPENASNYVVPGYLVMFVFFTAALSAERIVRERRNNTLERMLAGSVRRESIIAGTFLGTAAKGLIQIAIFWIVGLLIFKIDFGLAPGAVVLLSVLVIIMSSAFGVMLATLVKTERSASSIGVFTSLILAPLGGCWWPLFITPPWMQFIAKITPHGWATTGFNKLMVFGGDFNSVITEMLVLVGFAVVFGTIAIVRFRTSSN
jgi:ABC-2 type transport system permease protein